MENVKVYKQLIRTMNSRQSCIDNYAIFKKVNPENIAGWKTWVNTYDDEIEDIEKNYLPHGSGIDNGCHVNLDKSNENKIIIDSGYHCMDENGYYDGWIDFSVTVTPCLEMDISINIIGNFGKYHYTKEYLYDVFYYALYDTIYTKD